MLVLKKLASLFVTIATETEPEDFSELSKTLQKWKEQTLNPLPDKPEKIKLLKIAYSILESFTKESLLTISQIMDSLQTPHSDQKPIQTPQPSKKTPQKSAKKSNSNEASIEIDDEDFLLMPVNNVEAGSIVLHKKHDEEGLNSMKINLSQATASLGITSKKPIDH